MMCFYSDRVDILYSAPNSANELHSYLVTEEYRPHEQFETNSKYKTWAWCATQIDADIIADALNRLGE